MSLDFSDVKAITIPEGSVKELSIGGVVVWTEPQQRVLVSISGTVRDWSQPRTTGHMDYPGIVYATYDNGDVVDVTSQAVWHDYPGIIDWSTPGQYTGYFSYTDGGVTVTSPVNPGTYSPADPHYGVTITKVWTTVWSGTKTNIIGSPSSMYPNNYLEIDRTITTLGTYRITFEVDNSHVTGYAYDWWYKENAPASDPITSPAEITVSGTQSLAISYKIGNTSGSPGNNYTWQVTLHFGKSGTTNQGFWIRAYKGSNGALSSITGTMTMTVTKIEYYS